MPDASPVLDEALDVATSIGTSDTLGAVRAARAEHAWVNGDHARTRDEACAAFELAIREHHAWVAGELAYWRWQAGDATPAVDWLPEPFAYEMSGQWRAAAAAWRRLSCPYEEARALASGDEDARRAGHQQLQQLGARGAAQRLGRAMRSAGLTGIPRGPYASTRANPFGLTPRQLDILRLLAVDLGNAEIADRLSIAPKTVDHHVAAVLAKLEVHSRKAAVALARRAGVLDEK
jgi:DNA-binding CsgD family transcriptional regulator